MLPVGKFRKLSWGHDLYRMGVMGDGSCFFHSIFTIINSEYRDSPFHKKKEIVKQIRTEIANNLSVKDFMELTSNGTPLYKDLPQNVAKYRKKEYILPNEDVIRIKKEINTVLVERIHENFTPDTFHVFLGNYLAFRDYIIDPRNWVGDELHPVISKLFDVDLYIIRNDEDEKGFFFHDPSIAYKNKRSIILYNIDNMHWEPVLRLFDKNAQSVFTPEDPDIIELRRDQEAKWKIMSA